MLTGIVLTGHTDDIVYTLANVNSRLARLCSGQAETWMSLNFTVSTDNVCQTLQTKRVPGHYMVIIRLMIHVHQRAQPSRSLN